MFGDSFNPGRRSPFYKASAYRPVVKDDEKEKTLGENADTLMGVGAGVVGGAKQGYEIGKAASGPLAAIPYVGPALSTAAPWLGAGLGTVIGGVSGAGAEKGSAVASAKKAYEGFDKDAIRKAAASAFKKNAT